jgi:hypothetical protein
MGRVSHNQTEGRMVIPYFVPLWRLDLIELVMNLLWDGAL